jgi:hypothetical protein
MFLQLKYSIRLFFLRIIAISLRFNFDSSRLTRINFYRANYDSIFVNKKNIFMTQKQIELVRSTWSQVAILNLVDVGELFYCRIFEIAPQVRSMFHNPIPEQCFGSKRTTCRSIKDLNFRKSS